MPWALEPGLTADRSGPLTTKECFEFYYADCVVHKCRFRGCAGPSLQSSITIDKWPHTLVVNCAGLNLGSLALAFHSRGKQFVLRSVVLGNMMHFVSVIRFPEYWMVYDGMGLGKGLNTERFQLFPLTDLAGAQGNYTLDKAMYEVLEETVSTQFGTNMTSPFHDYVLLGNERRTMKMRQDSDGNEPPPKKLKVFESSSDQESCSDQEEGVSDFLQSLTKQMREKHKKAKEVEYEEALSRSLR